MAAVLLFLGSCIIHIHNADTVESDSILPVLSVAVSTVSAVLIVDDATTTGSSPAGDDAIDRNAYGTSTGGRPPARSTLSSFVFVAGLASQLRMRPEAVGTFSVGSDAKRPPAGCPEVASSD